ncbi:hypothetical protein GGH94_006229 [Coemansia aciculifera]|uniref:RRM domain-containing protein n=1 Tax=Coemansia aciculifera TaxID=417176 RepID=A0A9W8M2C8_9FUNG|nr:hypothetical protein GGH94_006229 [Coemansia aciculifera]
MSAGNSFREDEQRGATGSNPRSTEDMANSFLSSSMSQPPKHRGEEDSGRRGAAAYSRERGPSNGDMGRHSSSRHRSRSSRRKRTYERDRDDYSHQRGSHDRSDQHRRRSRSRGARGDDRRRPQSRESGRRSGGSSDVVPLHLRPKKLARWDLPPLGYENVTCLEAKAAGEFPPPGQSAGSSNVASFNPSVLFEHTHREENDHFRPSSRGEREFPSTASRQARRLYVGNLPYGVDEDGIATFFNDLMVRVNIAQADECPVQNIQINFDKNYAFVEFRDAEQATRGMGLDGVTFQNQKLKIRRPKDYIPPAGQPEPRPPVISVPGVISNTVPDSPDKVYVGGLPNYINAEQVIELLRAFGELKSFNLVKDSVSRMSRGFAFCEFADPSITDLACSGLNGMELGDRRLVAQRASVGSRGGNQLPGMAPPQQYQQQGPAQAYQNQPSHGHQQDYGYQRGAEAGGYGSGQRDYGHEQMQQHPPPGYLPALSGLNVGSEVQPTTVVQLLNMVTVSDLVDDLEYADILEDVREECGNYGKIVSVVIPRPAPDGSDEKTPGLGKIFIEYADVTAAAVAMKELAGRQFSGHTVVATYITKSDFDSANY